jgi:hypothetical protein
MEDQTLFFNPAKIARAREYAAALEKAEAQQKRTAADRKIQQAIAREEKARESADKKARKETERIAAREKAAKTAEKEVKKAQKAREMELYKTKIGKKRPERAQIKKPKLQKIKVGEKRSIDNNKIDKSRKRARIVRSYLSNQYLITESILQQNSMIIEHSNTINNDSTIATNKLQLQNTNR